MISAVGAALQPLLRRLDPERAHAAALAALRWAPVPVPPTDDPRLAAEAFGLRFPNPLGVAAGFDKNATVPDALLGLGFGFVEVGTITPRPQPGNARPRVFRLTGSRAVINRYGFNSDGHAATRTRLLARRAQGGLVGVNLGANKDTADRAADYAAGIAAFADLASYIAINVSSPNTPGLRDLQGAAALDDLLARAIDTREAAAAGNGRRVPLLLKIAPDLDETGLDTVVRIARDRRLDGMIVSNTTVARPPALTAERHAREAGGLSGRPLFGPATRVLAQTFLRVERQFPLIGVGGIEDAATAETKVAAGATLLQLYTALTFAGPTLVDDIKRGLRAGLDRTGATLASLCGCDAAVLARSA